MYRDVVCNGTCSYLHNDIHTCIMIFRTLGSGKVISIADHPLKNGTCTMVMANSRENVEVALNSTYRKILGKLLQLV